MRRAFRSSNGPLGSGRDWRGRLLFHHAPLAILSALGVLVFMGISSFDSDRYGVKDLFSGTFPREFDDGGDPAQHRAESGPTDSSGAAPQQEGGSHQRPQQHDGGQAPSQPGGEQTGTTEQAGGMPDRTRTFLEVNTRQFTFASGYVAVVLLGLTLLVGPANLMLRRRRPVSNYLARDIGTWAAAFSVVHVVYGLEVHASVTDPIPMFVDDGSPLTNSFGLANWTGLAATVIVVGLLAISSNFALGKLKAKTWKDLQRLNYALFGLVLVHAFFYGALLRTESPFTILLVLSAVAVLAGQATGVWLWRRRYAPANSQLAAEAD